MFFSVPLPGFGNLFVDAADPVRAAAAAQRFLQRSRISLEEGAAIGGAVPVTAAQVGNELVVNGAGIVEGPAIRAKMAERSDVAPGDENSVATTAAPDSSAGRDLDRSPDESQEGARQNTEQLFKFDVPVIGDLFVLASDSAQARSVGQQHIAPVLKSAGIPVDFRLGSPEILSEEDLPAGADPNFVIDSAGRVRDDLLTGFVPDGPQTESSPKALNTVDSPTFFVGKVILPGRGPRFFRVDTMDTSAGRAILESRFGPTARIEVVSTPEFLLETDADFLRMVQESELGDLNRFVKMLELVVEPASDGTADDTGSPGDGTERGAPVEALPFDVQEFPFASFQNAVAELGLNPEGPLGGTVGKRFDALAPVAQIGSLTGTINPIGQTPGALENFFSNRFGDLDIAAETFRDLLLGKTGSNLNTDQLLSVRALENPDISTGRGRADAADVFRLARAAAEDRFGSFVASRLLPSNARLFRELERQLASGDLSTDFLQFARQQSLLPA